MGFEYKSFFLDTSFIAASFEGRVYDNPRHRLLAASFIITIALSKSNRTKARAEGFEPPMCVKHCLVNGQMLYQLSHTLKDWSEKLDSNQRASASRADGISQTPLFSD